MLSRKIIPLKHALRLAAFLFPAAAALAQPVPGGMPVYEDSWKDQPGGYHDTTTTEGMQHRQVQSPANTVPPGGYGEPPPVPADGWRTPPAYPREDQVDEGRPNDAAHRADRRHTATLNRRKWAGYNAAPSASSNPATEAQYQAALGRYHRDMQNYRDEQARYSDRMAHWQAQTEACGHGHDEACGTPR